MSTQLTIPEEPNCKKSYSMPDLKCVQDNHSTKNYIDSSLIPGLLSVLPEMQDIEHLLDERCYALHSDEKLFDFSEFFARIISKNEELFCSKTNQEKSKILFDFHRDIIVEQLESSECFNHLLRSIFEKFGNPNNNPKVKASIKLQISKKLRERIMHQHTVFVRFALASTLGISHKDVSLFCYPDQYKKRELLRETSSMQKIYNV